MGDDAVPFCIQSCSKPFTYCLAQTLRGDVHDSGYESSGQKFNAFVLNRDGKPHNPMINAGAMVVASLIHPDREPAERFEAVHRCFRECAGDGFIGFDNSVMLSESRHADRNYALGHFMRERGAFAESPEAMAQSIALYFQACSVLVDCRSGAHGASRESRHAARHGAGPARSVARDALSCMLSAGMYDYSGRFAFESARRPSRGERVRHAGGAGRGICVGPAARRRELGARVALCRALGGASHSCTCSAHRARAPPPPPRRALRVIQAASVGDAEAVRALLRGRRVRASAADYDGRTALHLAAAGGHAGACRLLLCAGADPEAKDRWGIPARGGARPGSGLGSSPSFAAVLSAIRDHQAQRRIQPQHSDLFQAKLKPRPAASARTPIDI